MIKHWKTSLAGVGLVAFSIYHMHDSPLIHAPNFQDYVHSWGHDFLFILGGLGLIFAKDHNQP